MNREVIAMSIFKHQLVIYLRRKHTASLSLLSFLLN